MKLDAPVISSATQQAMLFLVAAIFAGCRHMPRGTNTVSDGHSAFSFMPPPPVPSAEAGNASPPEPAAPCDMFVDAEPIEPLDLPTYPPAALAARAGWSTVGVRLTIDPRGRVSDVRPSLMCFSSGGPFVAEFRAAVETAVARWRFNPAGIQHVEPYHTPDGKTYWQVVRSQPVETTCDVLFTFTAGGKVVTGGAPR